MRRGYKTLFARSYHYFATKAVKVHSHRISKDILKKHLIESRYLLARCDTINQVCDIIKETPNADTTLYNTALHEIFLRLYKQFTFYDVDYLLNMMKENNICFDIITYHEILKIYSRSGNINKCMKYFNNMVDIDGIKPNVVTFNRLIKCCRYSNNINAANEILRLMNNDFNISPDLYTYIELNHLYSQLKVKDLLKDNLIKIQKELNCGKRQYSHNEFRDVIDSMNINNIEIEYIEYVFQTMLNQNIIPDQELLNKMLFIVINRKDSFRIISYFDMLIELISNTTTNNKKIKPSSIAMRALELLIGKKNDFISSYHFIDNCIKYGIKITNKRILSLYWQCIKSTYLNLRDNDSLKMEILIKNVKDLPAQLQHLQIISILNKHRIIPITINELYCDILMSLLKLKNGDIIIYDILNYWYDSYYITKDLWNEYIINTNDNKLELIENIISESERDSNIITIFDVSDWNNIQIKTLLIFIILERFGDIFINQGSKFLNIKLTANDSSNTLDAFNTFNTLKNKLISSYGDNIKIDHMQSIQNNNIIQIDLNCWQQCVNQSDSDSDDDHDDDDDDNNLIDKDIYLE